MSNDDTVPISGAHCARGNSAPCSMNISSQLSKSGNSVSRISPSKSKINPLITLPPRGGEAGENRKDAKDVKVAKRYSFYSSPFAFFALLASLRFIPDFSPVVQTDRTK